MNPAPSHLTAGEGQDVLTARPFELKQVSMLVIPSQPRLDPIRVVLEDLAIGAGRIIIVCYDRAWVGYWGAMSGRTVAQFFCDCDSGYLQGNLMCGAGLTQRKTDVAYAVRIIEAVQVALRAQVGAAA